jgi:GDP-4-dehydro-6-deoxy-D-mannose reductase
MLGLQYYLSHGIDTVRVRPFNHIGPRQRLGFVASDFASQIARIEAGQQAPVMRVGHLGAERDFTDVRDVVRAYHLLVLHGEPGEVYNVGSGRSHAVREILDTLLLHSGAEIRVEPDPERMRPSDIPRVVCDYSKLRECTGWEPRISFEQSLADVLAYWRAQACDRSEE